MKEEGVWTRRLIERLAPFVKDAEPYPIVEIAEGSVVVGAYAIPDAKNPRILVLPNRSRIWKKCLWRKKHLRNSPSTP